MCRVFHGTLHIVMWSLFSFFSFTLKITNMSNLQEKSEKYAESFNLSGVDSNKAKVDYTAGYVACQKEYEEKLRWIPVEERLPEIGIWIIIQLKNQSSKNKYVTMLPKNDFEINYIKENVISWRSFL